MARKTISKEIREKVYQKYDGHCAYCGKEIRIDEMQVDHIVSKQFGGQDKLDNYNPSCRACNFYKSVNSLEVFRGMLKSLHTRIKQSFIVRLGIEYGIVTIKPFDGVFYYEN